MTPKRAWLLLTALLFAGEAYAFTVFYSNDILGDLEPCGCRANPYGGMVRRAVFQERLGKEDFLQLDGGDLLFASTRIPDALREQSLLQARYVLRALDQLGPAYVVPGEKDFALGAKSFDQLRKGARARFIAANLRRNGKAWLEPSVLLREKTPEGKALRIAILGLVGSDLEWPTGIHAVPAIESARAEIPKLRKSADLVIALTHQGYEADIALAEAVPGIDLIFGAHTQSFLQEPQKIRQTWIYQTSFRDQYVGRIPITLPFANQGHELVGLDESFEPRSDSRSGKKMAALLAEFRNKVAKLTEKESLIARTSPPSHIKYQTFPKCAECHLKQFDFWRKTPHASALEALLPKNQYKNKECLGCHSLGLGDTQGFKSPDQMALTSAQAWMETPHFADYLKSMREAETLDKPARFVAQTDPPISVRQSLNRMSEAWAPVQCENCHGPGRDHPLSGQYSKKVESTTCLKCHTAERAPGWYKAPQRKVPDAQLIQAKIKQISCPAGEWAEN